MTPFAFRIRRHRRGPMPALMTAIAAAVAVVTVMFGAALGAGVAVADVQVVTVIPSTVVACTPSVEVTFLVPSQANTAGMVGFRVSLPTDPLTLIGLGQLPGWTATSSTTPPVTAATAATADGASTRPVTVVSWTAQPGTRVGPGGSAEFTVTVGPVPPTPGSLVFPAAQIYDNGTVISWDDPVPASGPAPLHPVPTLIITDTGGGAAVPAAVTPAADRAPPSDTADHTPVIAAVLGAVAVVAVVLIGVLGYRRRRPSPSRPAP